MTNCRWLGRWLVVVVSSMPFACALLSKAEPLQPRYFSPEDNALASGRATDARAVGSPGMRLRLGRISAGPQLRERIVYRASEHELGYYEDRRWTERPDAYLRRALARTLFEERGLLRVVSGSAPTLEAELVAFEELRVPAHKVRMQVMIALDVGQTGSLDETITLEQDVPSVGGDQSAAVAAAFATALHLGVEQVADRVIAKLAALPQAPDAAPGVSSP
jgi:cholesterol transport system auxiliary component